MGWFFSLKKKNKVGLALGGGAARGIAHIGVIQTLQENKIPIDYISGVSAGSIVGCLYAAGLDIESILKIIKKIKWSDFISLQIPHHGLLSSKKIETLIKKHT